MLQTPVRELHNDMILPIYQWGLFGARNEYGKVCIGDKSLIKYIPKHIKPTSIINNITCGYETCISAMLFQYDWNKL